MKIIMTIWLLFLAHELTQKDEFKLGNITEP